ncbi:hypothetical protein P618_200184 [Holospora obtusa F1]|uniref:Uncharacterized protein n=1 Tax=Holospora obtusa F1 TaxID=1399147 RepID=W6TV26_HOLOB|nr:hypothetical protein P618_200184 [Holospora obtusa F1]
MQNAGWSRKGKKLSSKKSGNYYQRTNIIAGYVNHKSIAPGCLVSNSYGITYKKLKEDNLWEVYCITMPKRRFESEKNTKLCTERCKNSKASGPSLLKLF